MRALPALATAALLCACSSGRGSGPPRPSPCALLPVLGPALPTAIAADAWGGVALAGTAAAALRAGNAALAQGGGFVLRGDAEGNVAWIHALGAARPLAAAFAPDGSLVVVGAAQKRCFARRLDLQGREIWSSQLGGDGESSCRAVAVDERKGDVWAVGEFAGWLGKIASAGLTDGMVLRIAGDTGEMRLVRAFAGRGTDRATAVAVTAAGVVVVGGSFGGDVDASVSAVDFGRGSVWSARGADGFLLALDADGASPRWISIFGEDGDEEVDAVALREGRIHAATNVRRGAACGGEVIVARNADWARVAQDECLSAQGLAFDDGGRVWVLENLARSARARALSGADGRELGRREWPGVRAAGIAAVPWGFALAAATSGETLVCGKPVGSAGERTTFVAWVRDL